ncbi:zinc-dependent alcohol dehydrogenase [Actinomadura rugatobispora]|uniref:Zinc-binding dehydrogenase n=1 Tax=Actinomadura rugatobispora TaxID=1994 RepID=A0ABW0ZYB7_9ACTN|nr:L-threonine 3-dehydrogenase [Actinomadura rugatobispora]
MTPGTMLAAVSHEGESHFRLERVPVPELGDGDVLVRVEGASINSSTLLRWRELPWYHRLPAIIGIHAAGTVAARGRHAFGTAVGDRVHVDPTLPCGRCDACLSDNGVSCREGVVVIGSDPGEGASAAARERYAHYSSGCFAEYWRVPATAINRVPDHVPFPVAAGLGLLGVSYHALTAARPPRDATIVLTGATGGNGAAVVRQAPLLGVGRVLAVGRSAERLKALRELAPEIVEPLVLEPGWERDDGLTRAIRERTAGKGADALLDFLPSGHAITAQALFGLRTGSRAVLYGGDGTEQLAFDYVRAMPVSQYRLLGERGHGRRDMLEILGHLEARRLDPAPLVTHRFPLEAINDAVDLLDAHRAGADVTKWFVTIEPAAP